MQASPLAEAKSGMERSLTRSTAWQSRTAQHFSLLRDGAPLLVVLVVAFVVLERLGQRFWFFYDDWDFLLRERLGDQASLGDFFQVLLSPHNEHVSVVPRLWFWAADSAFGLESYTPYVTASIAVHLAAAVAGWVLLRQTGVDRVVGLLAFLIMVFFGAGAENIFWGFQVGFMGGLVFGVVALAVTNVAAGHWWRDSAGALFLVAAVLSSGTGIPMLLAVAVALLLRSGVWRATLVVGPAVVVLLVARVLGGVHGAGLGSPQAAVRFAAQELAFAVGAILDWRTAGVVVFIGLAAVYVVNRYRQTGCEWVLGMAVAAAAFALLTGISRSSGLATPETMRYLWFEGMLLIPVLAFLVNGAIRVLWVGRLAMVLITIIALQLNVQILRDWAVSRPAGIAPNKALLLDLVANPASLETMSGDTQPDPVTSPQVTVDLLRKAVRRGDFSDQW